MQERKFSLWELKAQKKKEAEVKRLLESAVGTSEVAPEVAIALEGNEVDPLALAIAPINAEANKDWPAAEIVTRARKGRAHQHPCDNHDYSVVFQSLLLWILL